MKFHHMEDIPRRTRILIVDDHPVIRVGLRAAIQQDPRLEVVAEASTGEAAIHDVERLDPDIVIIDLNLPQMNGIAAVRHIRQSNSRARILVLTAHNAEDLFHASLDAGANGYLLKESAFSEIVAAAHAVCAGGCYVTRPMTGYLLNRRDHPSSPGAPKGQSIPELSPIERRILSLIAQKKSSKEIAGEFGVGVRTIENRRTAICEKLGVSGVNSLLKYALDHKSDIG